VASPESLDQPGLRGIQAAFVHEAPVALVEREGFLRGDPSVLAIPCQLAKSGPGAQVHDGRIEERPESGSEPGLAPRRAQLVGLLGRQGNLHVHDARPALAGALSTLGLTKLFGAVRGRRTRPPGFSGLFHRPTVRP